MREGLWKKNGRGTTQIIVDLETKWKGSMYENEKAREKQVFRSTQGLVQLLNSR